MAIIYDATLTPGKLELLADWLPTRPWWRGDATALTKVATFRLDDPDGEVGMETFLLRGGDGPLVQVPLTYRAAPLPGAEPWLVGTMQHSVLGERWVHDGCADPVHVRTVATTIVSGGHEAEQLLVTPEGHRPLDSSVRVEGAGAPGLVLTDADPASPQDEPDATSVRLGDLTLRVLRHPVPGGRHDGPGLCARFADGDEMLLAALA